MAFIPAVNTARVEMVFSQGAQIVENVYHVLNSTGWDVPGLQLLGLTFIDWWNDNLRTQSSDNLSLNNVKVRDMTTASSPAVEVATGLPLVGTSTVPLPNSSTLAVKWITGLAGRSFRGRTYHLGLSQGTLVNPNQITAAFHTILQDAYDALVAAVIAGGAELVVASFFSGVGSGGAPIPRSTAVLTPIISAAVNNVLDSQRRRLPERGA